jgi:hypothetical protein
MHSFEVTFSTCSAVENVTALHVENVVRSTLSYPNETSKECIQFLNIALRYTRNISGL